MMTLTRYHVDTDDNEIVTLKIESNENYKSYVNKTGKVVTLKTTLLFDTWEEAHIHLINCMTIKIKDLAEEIWLLKIKRNAVMDMKKPKE